MTGNLVSMYYRDGHGQDVPFYALSQQISSSFQNAKEFPIPGYWSEKYNLPRSMITAAGMLFLIWGRDMNHIFPFEKERCHKLSLYCSMIDGSYIVAGTDSIPSQNRTIQVRRICLMDVHNENFMKNQSLQGNFSILSKVCTKCQNHTCEDCVQEMLKSDVTRMEEKINESSLHFVKYADAPDDIANDNVDSYDTPPLELNDEGKMDINEPVDSVNSDDIVQSNVEIVESCGSSPSLKTRDECVKKVKPVGYWLLRAKYNQKLTEMPDLRKECTTFQLRNEKKLEKMPAIKDAFNAAMEKRINN